MSGDDTKKKSGPNINDMILGSLKPRAGRETTKWMAGLTEEVANDAAAATAQQMESGGYSTGEIKRDGKKNQLMVGWVDHLFDLFQQYEYDFNRSVGISELAISVERPSIVAESVRAAFGGKQQVQFFKGRLSTRIWTMVIRGQNDRIEGFILPIDKLFSFGADSSLFSRFFVMTPALQGDELIWIIDGQPVAWEEMRFLAKKLFASLIKVAKGEATEDQPFTLNPAPAAQPQPQMPVAAPWLKPEELAQEKVELQTLPQQQPEPAATTASTAANCARRDASFLDACANIERAISEELVELAKSGAQAFAKQDMAAVQKNLSRTNRLKELQKQVTAAVSSWRSDFLRED